MEYDLTLFEKGLEELGIALSQDQKKQFITYYEYLVEKNKVMNLTAITEYEEVILKHFLDSLSIVKVSNFDQNKLAGKSVIDIGTGAGFPGIPLKIAFPELKITLLDSLNKRVNFLNEVIEMLGLKNVTAVHGRAEDYSQTERAQGEIRLLRLPRCSQFKYSFRVLHPLCKRRRKLYFL